MVQSAGERFRPRAYVGLVRDGEAIGPSGSHGDFISVPSDATWVPVCLLALLGFFLLQKAIRPGAKQSWSWGRSGGSVPLSRGSYACCAATLFSIAMIVHRAPEPPMVTIVTFMLCFLAVLGAGFFDTRRYNETQRLQEPLRNQRN
jgi:uncharacterized protein YneF (UPF0154 family)